MAYSFIVKRSADMVVNIHRLVHLATRNWLRNEGLLAFWTGRAIARLAEVLRDACQDNMMAWRSYMPHAYYALESRPSNEDNKDRLNLLTELCEVPVLRREELGSGRATSASDAK